MLITLRLFSTLQKIPKVVPTNADMPRVRSRQRHPLLFGLDNSYCPQRSSAPRLTRTSEPSDFHIPNELVKPARDYSTRSTTL